MTKVNYYNWTKWRYDQRVFYIYGLTSGMMAMGALIAYESGYVDLLRMTEDAIPKYFVKDYIEFVDWVYEDYTYRKVPIYVLIIKADEYTEMRSEGELPQ